MAARRSGLVQGSFEYPLYQLGKVIFAPPVTPLQGDAAHCSLGCNGVQWVGVVSRLQNQLDDGSMGDTLVGFEAVP